MAIKLNGVGITINKLNSSNVTLENLDGVKVWPTVIAGKEWVYVFSSTSSNETPIGQTGTPISINGVFNGGDINIMLDEINYSFPPDNYDVGQVIVVRDYDDNYYYYFQVREN